MFIHEELRSAREQAGLSQAQLAARAGIPRNQIVRAEKGENITLDTLRKIVVHLPVEQLTLIDTVKLRVDIVPQADKMFFGAMETVGYVSAAVASAIQVAMLARVGVATANANDPLRQLIEPSADIDVLLLLKRLQETQEQLDTLVKEHAVA